jgi:PPM family protein phosphatase
MLQFHRGTASGAATGISGQRFFGRGMLELEFAELTDVGKVREHNEDYFGHVSPSAPEHARTQGWLFALADGVGGQDDGEVASRLAIETLQAGFRDFRANENAGAFLRRVVQAANLKIYEAAVENGSGRSNMCTTIVACLLRFDRVTVAHVGDSRCYLIRTGVPERLTQDHSLVGEQVRMGLLSEEEAATSERRHILSRSLGTNIVVNVELNEHQLLPGDVLLLSSDGLHGCLTPSEIAVLAQQDRDLGQAARKLVAMALEKDGGDNTTVQLIRIKSVERMGMYRGRPYNLR